MSILIVLMEMALRKREAQCHITFRDSKRIISYEKGDDLQDSRHHFLRAFSDAVSNDVAPGHVKFQQYDETFEDYVDLESGAKLEENARLKAIVISKQGKKVCNFLDYSI